MEIDNKPPSDADSALSAHPPFEQVLASVANRLSNAPKGQFDSTMTACLQQLAQYLDFDRSTVMLFRDGGSRLAVTHCWATEGAPYPPPEAPVESLLPWYTQQIRSGHVVQMTPTADLPAAAAQERACLLDSGLKCAISIPLITESTVIGAVSFGRFLEKPPWPQATVTRLRLVGEVLGLGIRHHQYGEAMQTHMDQVSLGKDKSLERKRTDQLQRLAVRLIQTEQQERRRIGDVLHEDVMQILAGISMFMGSVDKLAIQQSPAISQATQLLQEAFGKLRRLAMELRPEGLSGMGILEGIRWLAEQMRLVQGLDVEIHADGQIEPVRESARFLLYDAARKLLDNVAGHAGCTKARLQISRISTTCVQLVVSDEGDGFDPARLQDIPSNSFGLFSIREQAELMGGQLEVHSQPGHGTQVTLSVPA